MAEGIDKKTVLAMIDSGRLLLTYKELLCVRGAPFPVRDDDEANLRATPWGRPPPVTHADSDDEAVTALRAIIQNAEDEELVRDRGLWHTTAARLTDAQWAKIWSQNRHRLNVADACRKWRGGLP